MIHIKKVAQLTGVTVRTLRYYDQIGLLKPASKTEGGHRLYAETDLKRLLQIQFLKSTGLPLENIKSMLAEDEWNWEKSLHEQLAYLQKEQERLKEAELTLLGLINGVQLEDDNWTALQKLMGLSLEDKSFQRENYFQEAELKQWSKLPNLNSKDKSSLEWITLLGKLQQLQTKKPDSEEVQNVISRMDRKRVEEFGEDNSFIDKLWEARKSKIASENLGLYPIDEELVQFLEDAYTIHLKRKHS